MTRHHAGAHPKLLQLPASVTKMDLKHWFCQLHMTDNLGWKCYKRGDNQQARWKILPARRKSILMLSSCYGKEKIKTSANRKRGEARWSRLLRWDSPGWCYQLCCVLLGCFINTVSPGWYDTVCVSESHPSPTLPSVHESTHSDIQTQHKGNTKPGATQCCCNELQWSDLPAQLP